MIVDTNGATIKVKNDSGEFENFFPITKAEHIIIDDNDKRLSASLSEIKSSIAEIQTNDTDAVYNVGFGGITQYSVLYLSGSNTAMTATSSNITHCNRVIGISTQDGLEGQQIKVKYNGEINNPLWNLTPGTNYYLGPGGNIVDTAPSSGFIQQIGIAKNATTLVIKLGTPIKLI